MQKAFFVIKVLSIIGIGLAIFLLWEQFFHPSFQPCNINAVVNCDAIVSGPVAKTLGVPTPLIGLIGYIVIFIAATLKKKRLLMGMATFGVAFCLWIAYKEIFELHVICPVCIACQIIMLTVACLSVALSKKELA